MDRCNVEMDMDMDLDLEISSYYKVIPVPSDYFFLIASYSWWIGFDLIGSDCRYRTFIKITS